MTALGNEGRDTNPPPAVPPEQQLKFQDFESTVTNWEESG
jgi:hypothetical protein